MKNSEVVKRRNSSQAEADSQVIFNVPFLQNYWNMHTPIHSSRKGDALLLCLLLWRISSD